MGRFHKKPQGANADLSTLAAAQHDHEDAEKCAHCAPVLKELQEIARLLRLQINHQGTPNGDGLCTSKLCWCARG